MIPVLPIVFLALLFLTLYGKMLYGRFVYPSGPTPLPIVGNILSLDRRQPHITVQEWSKTYGPVFTMWMANKPVVFVTDYELMKDAFATHGDHLSGKPRLYAFDLFTHGNYGIVFSTGDTWKEQRRFSLHVLRNFGVGRDVMGDRILAEVKKMSSYLLDECKGSGQAVLDLSMLLKLCVSNIIALIVFGHSFERGDPKFALVQRTVQDNFLLLNTPAIALLNSYPWIRHIPLFGHFGVDDLTKQEEILNGFLNDEVEAHKEKLKNRLEDDDEPSDFVDAYLKEMKRREETDENMSYFSEWQLIQILFDVFTAGMETTVTTLRWALLAMIKYPNIQRKVFEEIDNAFGRERRPSLSDRPSLPYVVATLNEVQRWGNIARINFSRTNDIEIQIGPYKIPKMTEIIPQIASLAIDENVFPAPEQFRPERFLESDGKTPAKIEAFAPFSMGKRQCMGEGLARAEMFLIFVHLVQQFEFLIPPGTEEPTDEPTLGITAAPKPYETLVKLR